MLHRSLIVGLVACQLIVGAPVFAKKSKADPARGAAITSDSANIEILRRSAVEACTAGQIEVALSKYESAIHMAEMTYGKDSSFVADMCFDAGLVAFKSDHLQLAEDNLTKAVHINPSAHQARMQLAKYYKARGRYSDAKTQLHKVLAHDPNNLEARELLALTKAAEDPSKIDECAKIDALIHGRPVAPASVQLATAIAPPPPVVPAVQAVSVTSPFRRMAPVTPAEKPAAAPVAKPVLPAPKPALRIETKSKKKDRKTLERERREQQKLERERRARELQQKKDKKDKNRKNKKGKANEPAVQTADDTNWGLVPRLRSKAVLLTPVGKKATKPVESTETAPPIEKPTEKPLQPAKPARPHSAAASAVDVPAAESATNQDEAPAPKKTAPKAKPAAVTAPVIAPPKRAKGGLVPPPPPVVPVFQPVVAPPPPAQPKPTKPKAVDKPKPDTSSSSKAEDDNPDFLLDWAGKNKKKGK